MTLTMSLVAYRQPIRPGDQGSDVLAVKRALRKLGVPGSGGLVVSRTAGVSFVGCIRTVQRQHHLASDGIYGAATHKCVAPAFDAYGAMLYRTAAIRHPPPPPVPSTAVAAAQTLLSLHTQGRYRADNPGDLRDIQAAAEGKPVWSQGGYWVHLSPAPLRTLCWLIEDRGFTLGTYAVCSDHSNDGPHGHAGGLAVDISSVHDVSISSAEGRPGALAVAEALHQAPASYRPRQLICGGYGNHYDAQISALTIPSAAFYGSETMRAHENHIHSGA
jgi:hypothetical protein